MDRKLTPEERKQKRSHRSRYSLNTSYTFGGGGSDGKQAGRSYSEEERNFLLVLGPGWPEDDAYAMAKLVRSHAIPPSMLGLLWLRLCGGHELLQKNQGVFDVLVARPCESDEERIIKDIGRTFPELHYYCKPDVQTNLFSVLKAYSALDPDLGYCQGMNFVAATLLMQMKPEEAFWCFVAMLKSYGLRDYFAAGVPELVTNLYCLDRLIELFQPSLFSHFKAERISPILFASEWFTTIFGYTFSLEFTSRIWTIFFVTKKPWLFRVAMGILRVLEKQLMRLPFEKIIMLLKRPELDVDQVIAEADRHEAIDEKLLARLAKEAASRTTAENLC